jgi:hypothetical protein
MNKKLFLLLTASVIALFFACSGEVVESIETSNKAELSLAVTVSDNNSGALLAANVSLNGGAPQQATNGVAVFSGVSTGKQNLRANIAGYAEMTSEYEVTPVTGQNAQIPRDYATTIKLYPLNSGLWGYLRYKDSNDVFKSVPKGVSVNLRLTSDRFVNKLFTVQTDSTGKYTFPALPAVGTAYTLWVSETKIGSIEFGSTDISVTKSLQAGSVYAGETSLSSDNKTNLFIVSDYPSIISLADIAKPITFRFTEPVNRNRIDASSIFIYDRYFDEITANITWNDSNNVLTLTPMGNWKDLQGIYLQDLKSISGTSLFEDYYPITVLREDLSATTIVPVLLSDTNKIDYNSPVYLKYGKVPGATSYSVYTNNNSEGVYRYTTSNKVTETVDTVTLYFSSLNLFREVGFLVQASNYDSKTILDETKAVKVKDKVNPTLTRNGDDNICTDGKCRGALNGASYDTLYLNQPLTSFFSTVDRSASLIINFSEPIQLSGVAEPITINNNLADASTFGRLKVERVWNNNSSQVQLRISIAGNATAITSTTNLDATLLITGIKDLSGNPFKVTYTNNLGVALPAMVPYAQEKTLVAIRLYTDVPAAPAP